MYFLGFFWYVLLVFFALLCIVASVVYFHSICKSTLGSMKCSV